MRLIDADAIRLPDDLPYKASVKRVLMQAPTIDAVPVVHGRWKLNTKFGDYECSVCGSGDVIAPYFRTMKMNYCPNCGAKMDGGEE